MRICAVVYIIGFMIIIVSSTQYNQRCTFSTGTCDWNLGRRWEIRSIDDEIDDKVLVAVDGNSLDKHTGFTDVITSPWLYLTSSCGFYIRLTFQFNIENEQDQIEVFLIKKDGIKVSSVGQWKAFTSEYHRPTENTESLWQQANVTLKATEEFRIEIEIRHFPDKKNGSTTWFALDDILIDNCPISKTTTPCNNVQAPKSAISLTGRSNLDINNASSLSRSFFPFRWKFNSSIDSSSSSSGSSSTPRLTLVAFILYILCAIVALTLLIILFAIVIFTYRKHCLPPSKSMTPMIDRRYHSSRKRIHPRVGIHNSHIDQDARTERTMVTTIRPCY